MATIAKTIKEKGQDTIRRYREDPDGWNMFIKEMLKVDLDPEQQEIVRTCQHHRMVSVASGTARGKDFTAACIAICFMYLTPKWDPVKKTPNGIPLLTENTKVFMTAPTDRQVGDIMYPDIVRHFNNAGMLPGRLVGYDIRTEWEEWFLTGFKADEHKTESWTGLHAVNICFIVTEGSGIAQKIFEAIEGNLQGNSLLLVIFNPNTSVGYAAESQKSDRFKHLRLDSLNAPNVVNKNKAIPGQVDWEWVNERVKAWCKPINPEEDVYSPADGDFEWEGIQYRPNDLFRVKVRAMFPKVSDDVLIPLEWVQLANENYKTWKKNNWKIQDPLRLGVDIAGMGRDSSVLCPRYGNLVEPIEKYQSGGTANHMEMVGRVKNRIENRRAKAFIDTIGEGAGVYSRCDELGLCANEDEFGNPGTNQVFSVKGSEKAADAGGVKLTDVTGERKFANMRAYLAWKLRDWLNPVHNGKACLPPDDELTQELTGTRYKIRSDGSIIIEPKEDIKARLNRSPDKFDGLAHTFYPEPDAVEAPKNTGNFFF